MRLPWSTGPSLPLGSFWFGLRTLSLPVAQAMVHAHVLGKTGSGKSYFLAALFLNLHRVGLPATLIDPHGDLAELVLAHLVARGALDSPAGRRRLIYLDLPAAAAAGRYLPFNVLDQPYDDHAMAEHLAEAARRAWPELASGAPTFENILKHSVIVLRQNQLPLTALADLLTNRPWRDALLRQVTDPQVVRFFHHRVDQWGRDEAAMKESTLNRADLLTLSPVLRYSLGQRDNWLDFRRVLDSGTSLIINLGGLPPDTRRLLGCLLTVGMEAAALSRAGQRRFADSSAGTPRRRSHHLLIDEFSQFMAQSEESLTRMLSETRKYGLFCVMAHQNWSQASQRLKGALQNVGLEVIFKAGRADAEYSARLLGTVDPLSVKHTVADEDAADRTHPAFFSLPEQWETHIQAIQALTIGQAFIRLPDDSVHRVRTPTLPQVSVPAAKIAEVHRYYLTHYFRPAPPPVHPTTPPASPGGPAPSTQPPPIRRHHPDEARRRVPRGPSRW